MKFRRSAQPTGVRKWLARRQSACFWQTESISIFFCFFFLHSGNAQFVVISLWWNGLYCIVFISISNSVSLQFRLQYRLIGFRCCVCQFQNEPKPVYLCMVKNGLNNVFLILTFGQFSYKTISQTNITSTLSPIREYKTVTSNYSTYATLKVVQIVRNLASGSNLSSLHVQLIRH